MAAVKDNNYISIQGWMRTKLNLKGNELLVYAVIYGFSQDSESTFKGSRKYIAEWCGCSLDTVDRSLSSLVAKGFIAKYPHTDDNGVRLVDYATIPTAVHTTTATPNPTVTTPSHPAPTATPTAHDQWDDTANATLEQPQLPVAEPEQKPQPKKTRKPHSFDNIIDSYTSDPITKDLLGAWLQNRKATRSAMTDRAIQGNIDILDDCARESRMTVNDYLAEIVRRGWKAFYPINNYRNVGYQQRQQPQPQQQWTRTPEEERQHAEEVDYYLKNCVF